MTFRIEDHPVLDFEGGKRKVGFIFNGKELTGYEGEPIIVALRANGVIKLKEGSKHHTPYGPFCMQGRCCSCMMNVNSKPNVMTCVAMLEEGDVVKYMGDDLDVEVFKRLPAKRIDISPSHLNQPHPVCDLAIIGAGPAGMEAAIVASQAGVRSIVLFDDKDYLGGQLRLQTHTFFGNQQLGASIRGYEIANQMQREIEKSGIDVRLGSTVIGLYPQNLIGFRDQDKLNFVMAKKIICATGASEKFLHFEGNCLPGVMGAGGAQTFMNIHGVKPGKKVLIVGGGNIGVILAYQLVQAGIEVACIIEASSKMGAYEVHVNKAMALGIPVHTRHTIVKAHGKDCVEGATIVKLDENWEYIKGTETYLEVDTICLAVGLNPLNELLWQAGCEFEYSDEIGEVPIFDKYRQTSNPSIFIAGDCAVIGEASIARLEGRIAGLKASLDIGCPHPSFNSMIDEAFHLLDEIQSGSFGGRLGLGKSKITGGIPKGTFESKEYCQGLGSQEFSGDEKKVILKCREEIPCNPCEASCKHGAIVIGESLNQQPDVHNENCRGCGLCLTACPGRAIRLVKYNHDGMYSAITIPYEFHPYPEVGEEIDVVGDDHKIITRGRILNVRIPKKKTGCGTVTFTVLKEYAFDSVAVSLRREHKKPCEPKPADLNDSSHANSAGDFVCRCEEVTYDDILKLIKSGYTTINEIKRIKRVGMGQCRGLSCLSVIEGILKREASYTPQKLLDIKKRRRSIFRPPLKRITLGEAAKLKFSREEIQLFEGIEHVRTIPQEIVNTYIPDHHKEKEREQAKIVIIGGGITGVMTAFWLARLGESDIVVLESNFLSSGQTGACLGGIRTGFNSANKVARAMKGLEVYRDAKNLIGEDVGWHQGGYVYLSFDEKQDHMFQQSAKIWDEAHVKYTYTTDKNIFNKYLVGVDASRVLSLVHFPEAGGANPFKAVYAFAENAKKMGVRFFTSSEVVKIRLSGDRVKGVIVHDKEKNTYRGINCEHLISCAGTSSVRVAKMAGIDLGNQVWIERHGAFITEKMPLWLDPLVVSYHSDLSGYWQQKRMEENVKEGEIVACYSADKVIKGFNTHSYIYFLARMAKAMLLCQPGMADVGIIRNFAEHYVGRESGVPIIGETPVKGFWLNMAKKGHGFMCAPGDGYALAKSLIEGRRHEWITECTIEEDPSVKETMK
ncbi:MAG: FAD-dependent oxidoreductase [Oligoflexales bacterium]|nr:FAD-dependent oxidoreductase [Oligoflexales bacterium]